MMIDDNDYSDDGCCYEKRVLRRPKIRPEVTDLAPIYYDLYFLIERYFSVLGLPSVWLLRGVSGCVYDGVLRGVIPGEARIFHDAWEKQE